MKMSTACFISDIHIQRKPDCFQKRKVYFLLFESDSTPYRLRFRG